MNPLNIILQNQNLIFNSIKNMYKCKAYQCSNDATQGFQGCSKQHGYEIKIMPEQIRKAQNGAKWLDTHIDLKYEEVGALIHYSQLV